MLCVGIALDAVRCSVELRLDERLLARGQARAEVGEVEAVVAVVGRVDVPAPRRRRAPTRGSPAGVTSSRMLAACRRTAWPAYVRMSGCLRGELGLHDRRLDDRERRRARRSGPGRRTVTGSAPRARLERRAVEQGVEGAPRRACRPCTDGFTRRRWPSTEGLHASARTRSRGHRGRRGGGGGTAARRDERQDGEERGERDGDEVRRARRAVPRREVRHRDGPFAGGRCDARSVGPGTVRSEGLRLAARIGPDGLRRG